MSLDSLLAVLRDADMMLPLLCSLISGSLIGLEREFQGKPAGLRTHTLVCFSSTLMTLVGLRMAEWTSNLPANAQVVTDMARMPHAILTGIGFLGAGVIFREGASVHGLTTAASLWLTAALGIVFGIGLLELGTIGTLAALAVLIVFRVVQRISPPKPVVRLEVVVKEDVRSDGAQLIALLARQGYRSGPLSIRHDRASGLRRYMLLVSAKKSTIDCEHLAKVLHAEVELQELAIMPLENETAAER